MFKITNKAIKYIYSLCKSENKYNLFFNINKYKNFYKFNIFFIEKEILSNFHNLFNKKFYIYTKFKSLKYLKNSILDIKISDNLKKELILNTKNILLNKFDDTLLLNKIKIIFNKYIDPYLNKHNGGVNVKCITKDFILILEFTGNCKNCNLIKDTIENYIYKIVKNYFPEISYIRSISN